MGAQSDCRGCSFATNLLMINFLFTMCWIANGAFIHFSEIYALWTIWLVVYHNPRLISTCVCNKCSSEFFLQSHWDGLGLTIWWLNLLPEPLTNLYLCYIIMLMCGGCPIWGEQRIAGWEPFTATPKGDRRTVAWTKLDAVLGIFPALVSILFVLIHQNYYSWRCLSSCPTIEFCSTLFFLCNHNIHFV